MTVGNTRGDPHSLLFDSQSTDRSVLRVALIDTVAGGHHGPYGREIAAHLRRTGHEALAVGPEPWCTALEAVATPIVVDIGTTSAQGYFRRQVELSRFFSLAFKAAAAAGAQKAHILCLDGSIDALLHAHVPSGLGVLATMHWYPFLRMLSGSPKSVIRATHSALGLWRLDRAGVRLIVHADVAKRRLSALGVRHVRSVDYPNVVDRTSIDQRARVSCRARLGVSSSERLLLCFGNTRHDKGVDLAIAALRRADPDLKLLVAGAEHDFDRQSLLQLARASGVEDRLLLQLGHVGDHEVFDLFCAADAVLLPYRSHFGGQSGPLVIAGSLGVPVIASDAPVLAEAVKRFRLGRTFRANSVGALASALRGTLPQIDAQDHQDFAHASASGRFGANHLVIYSQR